MALDTDSGFGVASQVQGSCLSVISRSNGIFIKTPYFLDTDLHRLCDNSHVN